MSMQTALQVDPASSEPGAARAPIARIRRGRLAHLAGAMAEENVARYQAARGIEVLDRRWRGKAGEIDLICRQDNCLVFVEVKQAQSHDLAAARLSKTQQTRICRAAEEFSATVPSGQMSEMRFDVALVDRAGRVEMLENAFGDSFG
jgi:putative endonuclease